MAIDLSQDHFVILIRFLIKKVDILYNKELICELSIPSDTNNFIVKHEIKFDLCKYIFFTHKSLVT